MGLSILIFLAPWATFYRIEYSFNLKALFSLDFHYITFLWFSSYFSGTSSSTFLADFTSSIKFLPSASSTHPYGSVLGPLLSDFPQMINSISCLKSHTQSLKCITKCRPHIWVSEPITVYLTSPLKYLTDLSNYTLAFPRKSYLPSLNKWLPQPNSCLNQKFEHPLLFLALYSMPCSIVIKFNWFYL